MALFGNLTEFDQATDDWQQYAERLDCYLVANKITDEGQQKAIFLTSCGAKVCAVLRDLCQPADTDVTLTEMLQKLTDHFSPKPSSIAERFEFRSKSRQQDIQQLIGHQDELPSQPQQGSSTLKQKDPQPPHIKEEEEELWITQDRERLLPLKEDNAKLPLTGVSVKTEYHEYEPPESSQLHHSPSEKNKGEEPPSSSSPESITTENDGEDCGGLQANHLLAPLSDSDDTTSHSPEDENDAQEPLSSNTDCKGVMRTHTDIQHSEGSEKMTVKKLGVLGNIHKGTQIVQKTFSCSVCGKIFSQKSYVVRHMRTHTGEQLFSCSVCDKGISSKSNMVKHMRTHTEEKPFSCSVCSKIFSQKSYVVKHMKTHTAEKLFSCSVCGKKISVKSNMVKHMRTHTGEKPFKCSLCGKTFTQKSTIKSHMRTHTGERPFWCSVCSKRFSDKSTMNRHMRTHTGEKPFCCSVCGEKFSQKTYMVKHMNKHTQVKHNNPVHLEQKH
ncbi:zinc finger protein OZF-like isoform X1 [Entelurus aequoreus]|uniref:zinc finger protein OZF-like isoform X1 n=1 Tax=Entelurus aequoreus TaxID=161455 RepID=UPI002B1E076D|nr:zinc finger protein OZF-like isoform X1 [Entelurus aequoreus]